MSRIARIYKSLRSLDIRQLFVELLIVVAGVLIAVAIDDYLTDKKQQLTVDTYLSNLQGDLIEDTLEIQRSMRHYRSPSL